jgi:CRP-like cAMP-binding protein
MDAAIREQLGSMTCLAELPATTLDRLAELARSEEYPVGHLLFREGGHNAMLYFICQGAVTLEMCVPGRGCMNLLTLGPGDLVAWSALLGSGVMTTGAHVVEPGRLLALDGGAVLALCEADHELGYHLMRRVALSLSNRLVATRLQLLDLFSTESATK